MDTSTQPKRAAAIISTEIAAATRAQMSEALKSAGWEEVILLDNPADFFQSEKNPQTDTARYRLHRLISDCGMVVLDEWVGGHSAFALSTIIRSGAVGKEISILLLADGTRSEPERDAVVGAAYVAGFDLLLLKPFDVAEFGTFARHIHDKPAPQNRS